MYRDTKRRWCGEGIEKIPVLELKREVRGEVRDFIHAHTAEHSDGCL